MMTHPKRLLLRSRLIIAGVVGLLLGLWTAGWWVGTAAAFEGDWLYRDLAISSEKLRGMIIPPEGFLAATWQTLGLPLPSTPLRLALCLAIGGMVVSLLAAGVASALRMDELSRAQQSIRWSARSCLRWPNALIAFLAPVAVAGTAILIEPELFERVALGFALLLVVCSLLGTVVLCRPSVVRDQVAGKWWRGPFPAARVVFGCVAVGAVANLLPAGIELIVPQNFETGVLGVLADLLVITTHVVFGLAAVAIAVTGSLRPIQTLHILRWPTLSAWLLMHAVFLTIPLALLGPVGSTCLILWKIVPVIASAYEGLGLSLPSSWQTALRSSVFIAEYWWLIFGFSAFFAYSLAAGRVVWLSVDAPIVTKAPGDNAA